jgi:hypothetical protein
VRWEFDGVVGGVDEPTHDCLFGGPGSITLEQFLGGDGFLLVWVIVGRKGMKHIVNAFE